MSFGTVAMTLNTLVALMQILLHRRHQESLPCETHITEKNCMLYFILKMHYFYTL